MKVKVEEDAGGDVVLPCSDDDEKKETVVEMEEFHMNALGPIDMTFEQETATTIVPDLEWKPPAGMAEEQGQMKQICLDTDDEEPEFKQKAS